MSAFGYRDRWSFIDWFPAQTRRKKKVVLLRKLFCFVTISRERCKLDHPRLGSFVLPSTYVCNDTRWWRGSCETNRGHTCLPVILQRRLSLHYPRDDRSLGNALYHNSWSSHLVCLHEIKKKARPDNLSWSIIETGHMQKQQRHMDQTHFLCRTETNFNSCITVVRGEFSSSVGGVPNFCDESWGAIIHATERR
jgi:hypothetical protein